MEVDVLGDRGRLEMLRAWACHDVSLYRTFIGTLERHGLSLEGKRVLDIGCGVNAPITLMLHSSGVDVTGIDTYIGHRWGLGFRPSRYMSYLKEVGLLKTCRKAIGELIYDRHYYKILTKTLGFSLTEQCIDLREISVEALPFDDSSFDVIYSNATWEHLADVQGANAEMARVLRSGGLAYVEIHLFPSLSGGHDLPWIVPGQTDFGEIVPWGHLRNPKWEEPVFLNRLREKDYLHWFQECSNLKIVDWQTEYTEGGELITDELLEQLPSYSQEELTKRSIVVIVQKI